MPGCARSFNCSFRGNATWCANRRCVFEKPIGSGMSGGRAIVAPMLTAREMLFVALGIFGAGYVWIWFTGKGRAPGVPSPLELLIGFVTNFFDTLGIGSFAPTAAIFKFRKMVPDEQIPGTLN